ncbi:MAG: RNA methyltransferase [Acidimicrobiia bacterium]|nr:RNA methyltransferase [Acidimicrobiia bacterium]
MLVLEGPTVVLDAVASGAQLEVVFAEEGDDPKVAEAVSVAIAAGCRVRTVRPGVLGALSDAVAPRPVLAVAARPTPSFVDVLGAVDGEHPGLVLCGVADPGNAGTLVRSAEGAGVAGVAATAGSTDLFAPKVVRAAAGSLLRLPVVVGVSIDDLVEGLGDLHVVGADAGGRPYDAPEAMRRPAGRRGTVLVLGNETHGIDPALAERLDETVAIPMAGGLESLNVAVAGSILLFELARRRRHTDDGAEP